MAKRISAVIGRLKGETKTTVQTIIFSPKDLWTVAEAKAWLREHDLKAPEVDETGSSLRFRQRDPGDFQDGSFRTIPFKGGAKEKAMLDKSGDKFPQADVGYVTSSPDARASCNRCKHFVGTDRCELVDGVIADTGWCEEFEAKRALPAESLISVGESTLRSAGSTFRKFIPFAKVDEAKREVWGIVTAEYPDKDDEVCDYETSVPFYRAVIAETSKAAENVGRQNFFPLREMHQLSTAGKCIGFDFRNSDKEIFMGFKVVDDAAWKKVDEGAYTGFSQGGRMVKTWADPVFKGCTRYTANPSEISLVDNPCLSVAHFAYLKADGTTEMRKLRSVDDQVVVVPRSQLVSLNEKVATMQKVLIARGILVKAKTKRVAGEDLPASAFLIVGDPDKTDTWKLPVEFASEAKTKRHVRNALARFGQLKDVPQEDKDKAWKRLVDAAKKYGIDVAEEKSKVASIQKWLRTTMRAKANRLARTSGGVAYHLAFLDDELGKLAKGMYEVGRLALLVNDLGFLLYNVLAEQEWEQDKDSPLPGLLSDNINDLLDTLLEMVQEEASEMRDEVDSRVGT